MGDIPRNVPSTTINGREKGDRLVCHSHLFGRNLIAKQKKSHRQRSEIYHQIEEHLDTVLVRNAKKQNAYILNGYFIIVFKRFLSDD